MFKKRRQRSKKYTLTSFGSVDEGSQSQDSQEEDGVFPGSESEIDEDNFSAAPDPTWDSDYLDMLEKRATAGTEGRGDGAEDAPSPGLSDTAGKGAQLFEQQRKRAAELTKKLEAAQPHIPQHVQEQAQMIHPEVPQQNQPLVPHQQMISAGPASTQQELSQPPGQVNVDTFGVSNGGLPYSSVSHASIVMSSSPVASKSATASVTILTSPSPPCETPLPDLPASNVLNRTARPFTPGFISIRAATAPVQFRPPVTKTTQRTASAFAMQPPFSTATELAFNATNVISQLPQRPLSMSFSPSCVPQGLPPQAPVAGVTYHPAAISTPAETMHSTTVHQARFATAPAVIVPPVPQPPQPLMAPVPIPPVTLTPSAPEHVAAMPPPPVAQPLPPKFSTPTIQMAAVTQPEVVSPTSVSGPFGRTGILIDARRRSGKVKPMFNVPEVKKNSPNPELLCMVQNLDDRSSRYKYGQPPTEVDYGATEEEKSGEPAMGRVPPPVAPKPRVVHEAPQILHAGGKGADMFARRQCRMGKYVVDTPQEAHYQQEMATQYNTNTSQMDPSQFKYSPNVRAPPPIGYNPLLGPCIPRGPQKDLSKPEGISRGGSQREGIKALDFMKRQPYQLNPAMFSYSGSVANLSAMPSYQAQRQQQAYPTTMVGTSLASPKQIPLKTARVYEIKRFSTPTPMSAPTLATKVIAPRSATTLGERLNHSDMTSPPTIRPIQNPVPFLTPAPVTAPTLASPPSYQAGLPNLPKFSSPGIPNPVPPSVPTPYTPVAYTSGLQAAKQFQSAPELSIMASLPALKANAIQAPKPHFIASRAGIQPRVWRPGAM